MLERFSSCSDASDAFSTPDYETKVNVSDRLKRYVTQKRVYNYFGPFTAEEVIVRVRRDDEGGGLYDILVQCLGGISWTVTMRYAQLYESYKWQVKYDKDLKLPLTYQFPPKFYKYTKLDDYALEARRDGLEKWINGRITLVLTYESEPDVMANIEKEMSFLLKIGQHGPSMHSYNRNSTQGSSGTDTPSEESLFSVEEFSSDKSCGKKGAGEKAQVDDSYSESTPTSNMSCSDGNNRSCEANNEKKDENTVPLSSLPESIVRCSVPEEVTSSVMFSQCRSVWVPRTWLYVALVSFVCFSWAANIHMVYTLLMVSCGLEAGRRLEDRLWFSSREDVQEDRECSLTGVVRGVFVALTVLCYLLLHAISFILTRSRSEE